ncbi:MAG TPA: GatB/YqeY domain-containing protein [Longimicrobiales bacterium]|nr:GatB/YqeY domain-containing protein [Longimicrobiales bacterium]
MASQLKSRLQADLNQSRKQRDKGRTLVLSTILADLRYKEIDDGQEASDDVVVQVISRAIKQRKDASEQMSAAGRDELAAVEDAQAEVLAAYLPEGMSEDELRALVREAIAGGLEEMGPLMASLMPKIRGRFDGREANRIVREELGT